MRFLNLCRQQTMMMMMIFEYAHAYDGNLAMQTRAACMIFGHCFLCFAVVDSANFAALAGIVGLGRSISFFMTAVLCSAYGLWHPGALVRSVWSFRRQIRNYWPGLMHGPSLG